MSTIPPLIKQDRDLVKVHLDRDINQTLTQYAQFIDSPRDYVLCAALRLIFSQDPAFTAWRAAQGLVDPPPSLPEAGPGPATRRRARPPADAGRTPPVPAPRSDETSVARPEIDA